MKVKHNKSIPLKVPRFVVDHAISDELEKYDVLTHLNRSSVTAFVGTSGSGKTSLMYSLLTNKKPKIYRKAFETIIVVMPRASRQSLKSNIFDKHLSEECLFDYLSEDAMDSITSTVTESAEQGHRVLLILDDVATALKDADVAKKLMHLCFAYRHYRLNIQILVQTLRSIPAGIRKNLTNLIVFHKPRLAEWQAITEEYLEMDKSQAHELFNLLFQKKYSWCLLNLTSGKIYKEFDQVLYKTQDLEEKGSKS